MTTEKLDEVLSETMQQLQRLNSLSLQTAEAGKVLDEHLKKFSSEVDAIGGMGKQYEVLVGPIHIADFVPGNVKLYADLADIFNSARNVLSKLSMRTNAEVLLDAPSSASFNGLCASYVGRRPKVVLGVRGLMLRYNVSSSQVSYTDELRYIIANAGPIADGMRALGKERSADAFLKIAEALSPLKYYLSSGIHANGDWNVSSGWLTGIIAPMELKNEVVLSSGAWRVVGVSVSFGWGWSSQDRSNPVGGKFGFIISRGGEVRKLQLGDGFGNHRAEMVDYAVCWHALRDELGGNFSLVRDAVRMALHEAAWNGKEVRERVEEIGARWLMLQSV
jgi:hypothetical protein